MSAAGRSFLGGSALLFLACATLTVSCCASMAGAGGMPMPGGWTMSMTWMRMPGQSWPGAAVAFEGMWVVMMMAMMLPTLTPTLWRHRQTVGRIGAIGPEGLTGLVAVGYFAVWALWGLAAFPLGVFVAEAEMRYPALARGAPVAVSAVVLITGALQFTSWKARQLACCREMSCCGEVWQPRTAVRAALRYGLRLGARCSYCCAGLTAVLLVVGVMDIRVMAALTAAIALERLSPFGLRAAHAVGAITLGAGLVLMAISCAP
jgi:predicted metal-binding membrane protein